MIENRKCDFRKSAIRRLKFYGRLTKIKKDKIIIEQLKHIINSLNPKSILLYIPMGFEVDVRPLIHQLRRETNIDVYVPYMINNSFKAVKYRFPLRVKRFGIKEPAFSFLNRKLDLCIVPILGVDGVFKRIGFGAGMYDRFFWNLKYRPSIIFTQICFCKTDKVLSNQYDIEADYIVTT